jgi:hypothetical protein
MLISGEFLPLSQNVPYSGSPIILAISPIIRDFSSFPLRLMFTGGDSLVREANRR